MKSPYSLEQLVPYIRQYSKFYRTHLKHLPLNSIELKDLPLINVTDYWAGSNDLQNWPVLTGFVDDALVFKTVGSTSQGKLSVYSRDEWHAMVSTFGQSLATQLNHGDRVANLFFSGDLYASFLFTHHSLAHVGKSICEFPFTGQVELDGLAEAIARHRINVLAGVPAQLLRFAAYLSQQRQVLSGVETLLYAGESLFAGQLAIFTDVFPNARIASIGYASVDAGLIGASDRGCALGEHRVFERHTLLEIIDELTGEVIEECDRTGRLVVTNLTRRLMPLLRYPVGDSACWREPFATPRRKFALKGRSADSQRIRVGVLSLFPSEISEIVQRIADSDQWQLLIEHTGYKDILSMKWVPEPNQQNIEPMLRALQEALVIQYPGIDDLSRDGLLELRVLSCAVTDLSLHPRSGKQPRILDLRVYDAPSPEPE
ncbi:phenylacetate--CoA ligase family protein [Pseudomonas sp. LT1P18]|uniref:phenylacetate--CoA ligase family protein n=1 Tax=Pseudomonas arabinosi TaxID=3398357 RepID=UPI0039EDF61A